MVVTRSGRATTKEENEEIKKKTVEQAKKRKRGKQSRLHQILTDLRFWEPTEATFISYGCLFGLMTLFTVGWTVGQYLEASTSAWRLLSVILMIHAVDTSINFTNDDGRLNELQLFSEGAVNCSEAFLFLFIVNKATFAFVVGSMFVAINAIGVNMKYKWWVTDAIVMPRMANYWILLYAVEAFYVMNDIRLQAYFIFVFFAMIVDAFDIPDRWFDEYDVPICEGLVVMARSGAFYMMVTALLLMYGGGGATWTDFELSVFSKVGLI